MKAPIRKLKKIEMIWLNEHYCKAHRMPYMQHYTCYLKENPQEFRIGFLDIETAGSLTADFGYVLCYSILPLYGKIISQCITSREVRDAKCRDKRLVQQFCKDVRNFDKLVVYFGKDGNHRHDIPFLRTRALKWGIQGFPTWREIKVQDCYDIVKTKLKLARRRQFDACRAVGIKPGNHPVNPDIWQNALAGDIKAIKYIFKHNKEDVYDLRKLWTIIVDYSGVESST